MPRVLTVATLAGLVPVLAMAAFIAFPGAMVARYELWQGDRHLVGKEYGAAIRHFEAAAQAAPGDALPYLDIARSRATLGDTERADAAWREALVRDEGNAEALAGLGRAAAERKDHQTAIAFYLAALARQPDAIRVRAELADEHAAEGDLGAAQREWDGLLRDRLAEAEVRQQAHYELGLLALRDDARAALDHLHRAQAEAASAVPASKLTEALAAATSLVEGKGLERPVADDMHEAYAATLLANTYLSADKPALAEAELELAVAVRSDNGEVLAYLGYLLWQRGESERGLALLAQARGAAPDAPLPHYLEGLALRGEQRWGEATAALASAARLDPENCALHTELARALTGAADYAAAAQEYERAVEMAGQAPEVLIEAASFHADHLFLLDSGLRTAEQLARLKPESAVAQDLLGWLQHLTGDRAAGEVTLRRALALDATYAKAQYHLAVVLDSGGNRAAAQAAYERVTDLDDGWLAKRAEAALAQ